jgi:hypothetical protein
MLYQGAMIRALLADRKTQTRRLIPHATQEAYSEYDDWCRSVSAGVPTSRQWEREYYLAKTRIKVGDRIWVREAWRTDIKSDHIPPRDIGHWCRYEADGATQGIMIPLMPGKLRPSMFMPRWMSRLTLTVTDIRVRRLHDISEEDAIAEGIEEVWGIIDATCAGGTHREINGYRYYFEGGHDEGYEDGVEAYRTLWNSINGNGSWDTNPWILAYTFAVRKGNIDQ